MSWASPFYILMASSSLRSPTRLPSRSFLSRGEATPAVLYLSLPENLDEGCYEMMSLIGMSRRSTFFWPAAWSVWRMAPEPALLRWIPSTLLLFYMIMSLSELFVKDEPPAIFLISPINGLSACASKDDIMACYTGSSPFTEEPLLANSLFIEGDLRIAYAKAGP